MNFAWPQITWLILATIGIFIATALDGQPKTGKHSFAVTTFSTVMVGWLLWMGGFFS